MKNLPESDPQNRKFRQVLRAGGPALAALGFVLSAVGIIDFFRAFGTFEPPRYFFCAVIGLPMLGLGIGISKLAYLGAILRYFTSEAVPVQRDAFNTLAEGSSPGVETLARAVGRGLVGERHRDPESRDLSCPHCQAANRTSSLFCNQCGRPLGSLPCPGCGKANAAGARYCDQCGSGLG